ncbi:MAG: L-threonylcarbamoyladenylate synthase [Verrucomicrobiota bacterium]
MKTEVVFARTPDERAKAIALLRAGDVVGLPTETVYGLAADALNAEAVVKVFEAKERPRFDPLIVHLPDRDWLEKIVDLPVPDRKLILKLAESFWPGPFTMVLPRREIVPEIVTAGLDTVAVRISAHPVFSEIIRDFGAPLAAPSANRFGRVSPTTAQHVLDELDGRISLIVDAGATTHGIESTIVAVRGNKIDILRRGPITEEQLSPFGAKVDIVTSSEKISAPGQLPTHYAPKTPLQLIDTAKSFSAEKNKRVGLLAWATRKGDFQIAPAVGNRRSLKFVAIRQLSEQNDLREAAANLFRDLRELDALEVDLIVAERVPEIGLGAAIMDRLRRAAHHQSDKPGTPERIL